MEILTTTGDVFSRTSAGLWLHVKSNGKRTLLYQDGSEVEVAELNVAQNMDPETQGLVYCREDLVLGVSFADNNTCYVSYRDGTQVYKTSDLIAQDATSIFCKEGYPSYQVSVQDGKATTNVEFADGCFITIIPNEEVSVLKDGHRFTTSIANYSVEFEPSSLPFQKNRKPKAGLYSFNFAQGNVKTTDIEGNSFYISGAGRSMIKYCQAADIAEKDVPASAFFDNGTESTFIRNTFGSKSLPDIFVLGKPSNLVNIQPPRLFSISKVDGSATEYLCRDDILPFLEYASLHPSLIECTTSKSSDGNLITHNFVSPIIRPKSLIM